MDDSWREQREVHQRIRWARVHRTEFVRPIDGARSLNIKPGTYRTYEQAKADDGRVPPIPILQKIAAKYGVSWQWLATGEGSPDEKVVTELQVIVNQLAERIGQVPEEKREDAMTAVQGVLDAFARRVG
jgi:transcriptional regulator with XRE-family HTH domain